MGLMHFKDAGSEMRAYIHFIVLINEGLKALPFSRCHGTVKSDVLWPIP